MTTPAAVRDAASVVLLRDRRDRPGGLELYLVKRSRTLDFMAGAHVFPGARLDKGDSSPSVCALLSADAAVLAERLGESMPAVRAAGFFVAAIRETFQEAGLLLGELAAGWETGPARRAVNQGAQFTTLVGRLDVLALVPWAACSSRPRPPRASMRSPAFARSRRR